MSLRQVCAACANGACDRCVPQSPPRDPNRAPFFGGTSCPCRHTDEDRAEWKRQADEAFRRFFGGAA